MYFCEAQMFTHYILRTKMWQRPPYKNLSTIMTRREMQGGGPVHGLIYTVYFIVRISHIKREKKKQQKRHKNKNEIQRR